MWLAFCELQNGVILIIQIWMANAKIAGLIPNKEHRGKGQLLRSQSCFIPIVSLSQAPVPSLLQGVCAHQFR